MALFDAFRGLFPARKRRKKQKRHKRSTAVRKTGAAAFVPGGGADGLPALGVLVADLAGRNGKPAAERVAAALTGIAGLDAYRRNQPLKQPALKALLDRLTVAAEEGRAWLSEEGCALLIWGEVEEAEGQPPQHRLRFLAKQAAGGGLAVGLGDSLLLPADDAAEVIPLIAAAALAAIGPGQRDARAVLLPPLVAQLAEIEGLVATPPAGFTPAQQASVLITVGNAHAAAALMGGGSGQLGHALAAFRAAIAIIPKDEQPLDWALAAHHAAAVLEARGRKAKDAAPLEEAAQLYRDAADALGRDANPLDWASTHVHLGQLLYRLSGIDLTHIGQHLKDAAAAYEVALAVYDRQATPRSWGDVMNHRGVALLALGEQVSGTAVLEQAIEAFRNSLEVRTRERAPLLWAQTANNLGAASFALAKRTSAPEALREAAAYFETSAEEFRKHAGYEKRAAVIEKNLGRVQRLLGTR